jgi:hypothetical protein
MTDLSDDDKLLLLAGECEHAPAWLDGEWVRKTYQCVKCGYVHEGDGPYPRVGDGRELDLGEMVRLCCKDHWCRFYRDGTGYQAVVVCGEGRRGPADEHWAIADTPEAALRAAILAAADKPIGGPSEDDDVDTPPA